MGFQHLILFTYLPQVQKSLGLECYFSHKPHENTAKSARSRFLFRSPRKTSLRYQNDTMLFKNLDQRIILFKINGNLPQNMAYHCIRKERKVLVLPHV